MIWVETSDKAILSLSAELVKYAAAFEHYFNVMEYVTNDDQYNYIEGYKAELPIKLTLSRENLDLWVQYVTVHKKGDNEGEEIMELGDTGPKKNGQFIWVDKVDDDLAKAFGMDFDKAVKFLYECAPLADADIGYPKWGDLATEKMGVTYDMYLPFLAEIASKEIRDLTVEEQREKLGVPQFTMRNGVKVPGDFCSMEEYEKVKAAVKANK